MRKIIIALLLLVSSSAFADEWSTGDTGRETTYQVLAAVDWAQTRGFRRGSVLCSRDGQNNCYRYEQNVILGPRPSQDRIDAYFVATGIAHYLISKALPEKYRTLFQYISIGVEVGVVSHNFSFGVAAKF